MAALTGFQPVTYALEGHCSCTELQSYSIYYLASGEGLEPSSVGVKVPCAYQFHHPDIFKWISRKDFLYYVPWKIHNHYVFYYCRGIIIINHILLYTNP